MVGFSPDDRKTGGGPAEAAAGTAGIDPAASPITPDLLADFAATAGGIAAWLPGRPPKGAWTHMIVRSGGVPALLDEALRSDARLRGEGAALARGMAWPCPPAADGGGPNALIGVIERERDALHCLVLVRAPGPSRFTEADVGRLKPLLGVLRAWLHMAQWSRAAAETATLAAAALDELALGVVIADARAQVQLMNRRARQILAAGDGVRLVEGRIRCTHADDQVRLEKALAGPPLAADGRPAAAPPRRTLAALRIGRERMPAPLHLLMSRLPDRSTSGALAPVRQALFLSDPHEQPIPQEDWLCALYALSRVEARVTALLAQGEKPHAIASRLGLSVYTVRGYMKEIFHKVGADRQASLIRCLLSGLAQLDGEITVDPVVIGDERAALPHLAATPVTRESHGKPAAPGANGFKFLHK